MPDKVKVVQECTAPTWKSKVRNFLRMTGYLAKFILRYAFLIQPPRELTRIQTKLHWGSKEQEAFEKLKHSIRFSSYLMGAPKFTIATAHKPLLPSFTKVMQAYVVHALRNGLWTWRMSIVKCESGEVEADPFSRNPLFETEDKLRK